MCWSCILRDFRKRISNNEGRAEGKPLPLLPLYLPSAPAPDLPSRSGAPLALRARNYFHFSLPTFFSQFFFPLLHPDPLLPPPFPSSPLPLTLSAPQLYLVRIHLKLSQAPANVNFPWIARAQSFKPIWNVRAAFIGWKVSAKKHALCVTCN